LHIGIGCRDTVGGHDQSAVSGICTYFLYYCAVLLDSPVQLQATGALSLCLGINAVLDSSAAQWCSPSDYTPPSRRDGPAPVDFDHHFSHTGRLGACPELPRCQLPPHQDPG